jgi:hypothetical protein
LPDRRLGRKGRNSAAPSAGRLAIGVPSLRHSGAGRSCSSVAAAQIVDSSPVPIGCTAILVPAQTYEDDQQERYSNRGQDHVNGLHALSLPVSLFLGAAGINQRFLTAS